MYEEERREERERGGVVRGVEVILHKSSTEYAGRRSAALSRALNAQIGWNIRINKELYEYVSNRKLNINVRSGFDVKDANAHFFCKMHWTQITILR